MEDVKQNKKQIGWDVTMTEAATHTDTDREQAVQVSTEGNANLFAAPRPQRAKRGGSHSRGRKRSSASGRVSSARTDSGDDSDESYASATSLDISSRRGKSSTAVNYAGLMSDEERVLDRSLPPPAPSKSSIPLPEQEQLELELRYEPMTALAAQKLELTADVERVASVSKGLKGTFQRSLRLAARRIRAINVEMAKRTAPDSGEEELARLRLQLRQREEQISKQGEQLLTLTNELAEVRGRLLAFEAPIFVAPARAEKAVRPASPLAEQGGIKKRRSEQEVAMPDPVAGPSWMEVASPAPIRAKRAAPAPSKAVPRISRVEAIDLEGGGDIRVCLAALMQQVSSLRAEFMGALQSRGGKEVPPIKKKGEVAASAKVTPRSCTTSRKGQQVGRGQPPQVRRESTLEARMRDIQEETRLVSQGESWATVVGRKAKRAQEKKKEGPPPTPGGSALRGTQQSARDPPKKPAASVPAPKRKVTRPPKTAIVTLTLAPEARATYAEVMATARERVDLRTIGITEIRPRRAVTGGLVLEIPGEERTERAAALAGRLQEVFEGIEVRVSRPMKMGEMRISGLDNSVTPVEVAAALAAVGGCAPADLKVGEIRISPARLGTVWAKCPLTALKKIAASGRILVGWSSARVEALSARPLHCFRCLEKGHVRQRCTCVVDRSDRCYVCGESDHKAATCSASPRCPLCTDLGRNAGHRLGAMSCAPKSRRPNKEKGAVQGGIAPPPTAAAAAN
ncbi:uncharacterized protein LOC114881157 [Osmia bicornis bicornis]|uniref:uncharacterized protein LOC114881157 n=1 Tax=Osmia bicornis bicornis TaxID=1437191 RepID=UPI001EAF55E8|nr:uncharacterized protein LOC114881157 [Osmia bicornis bicornis]